MIGHNPTTDSRNIAQTAVAVDGINYRPEGKTRVAAGEVKAPFGKIMKLGSLKTSPWKSPMPRD